MTTRYSIGEFSKISGVTPKTLRFYHEKGILVPASIDQESGYRFYNGRSLERVQIIKALRALDFSLEEISVILAEGEDDGDILARLELRKEEIAGEIKRHRGMISTIDRIIAAERETRRFLEESPHTVEEKEVAPLLVAGTRVMGRYADCGPVFGALGRKLGRHIAGKPMCLYYDGEYKEEDADFEPCFPVRPGKKVDDLGARELAGGRCLSLIHSGPYQELGRSYAKVIDYANRNRCRLMLPGREIYIKGPGMIFKGNPKKYVTEIQMFFEKDA